jgi:hypothetical protein
VTATSLALRRRGRVLAWLAATGMAIAGIAGAGSAGASGSGTPAPPSPPAYTFSTAATAIGIQVAFQQNPELSSLPDPFDVRTPEADGELDSFGTSQADGHIGNLNGLGGIPGLICLLAGAATCAEIPIGSLTGGLIASFPPPDPLDAHAVYPATPTAKAPVIGTTAAQASFDSSGFSLGAATANATANQYDTSATVNDQNLGIAGVLSVGSATASTTQNATADGVTTVATTAVSDIDLGGKLLSIGALKSTTTVVSVPGKPATDTTSTVLSDVKALGLPATIDHSGIHIDGKALPGNLIATVQNLLDKTLGAAGIHVSIAEAKSSNADTGHTVKAAGLLITFDRTVTGIKPIVIAPPTGIPCPPQFASLPIDPCAGVSLSLDAAYHGQVALGQVGVVSLASPSGSTTPPPITSTPGTGPSTAPGTGVGPGSTGPIPPPPGVTTSPEPGSSVPPVIAGNQAAAADQLKGASHRLLWFFPLFFVALLSIIGRFRTPARLPKV